MAAQADLTDDIVGETEGLVPEPRREMRAAKIEEDALGVVELLLPEEQLAIHLDADANAIGERRARNPAHGHDSRRDGVSDLDRLCGADE